MGGTAASILLQIKYSQKVMAVFVSRVMKKVLCSL